MRSKARTVLGDFAPLLEVPHLPHYEEDAVPAAISIIRSGGIVIVVDDDTRENEGDLIASAQSITPGMIAFMVNHSTGILCAAMDQRRADSLRLPPMVPDNEDPHATAFTITCDARRSGTGVSSADRCLTFRTLAAARAEPSSLRRPGHVFPLRARAGGVLERRGHTEAAYDLVRLAGHTPVGVLCELTNPDGSMMRRSQVDQFARQFGLLVVAISELVAWRLARNDLKRSSATAAEPRFALDIVAPL